MTRPSSLLFHIGLVIVVLAPAAFGATRMWAYSLLGVGAAALLAMVALSGTGSATTADRSRSSARTGWLRVAAIAYLAATGWAAIQALPGLPAGLHHPIWREAGDMLMRDLEGTISVSPSDSRRGVGRLLTYFALFVCAYRLCRDDARAERTLQVIAFATATYAIYGLATWVAGAEAIFGMPKYKFLEDVTGTFFNRNVFAVFQGIGLTCAVLLLVRGGYRAADGSAGGRDGWRAVVERLLTRDAPLLGATLLIAAAILASHSRAGLAVTAAGVGVAAILLVVRQGGSSRDILRASAPIATIALLMWVAGGTTTAQRLATIDEAAELRAAVHAATARAIADRPLLGTGLGTFEHAFQAYTPAEGRLHFQQAHNSYLENMMELGIPAALLLNGALLVPIAICVIGVRRRRRGAVYPLAALGASVILALHALVDFSLQIPAIAATYAWLLGMGCARSQARAGAPGTAVRSDGRRSSARLP